LPPAAAPDAFIGAARDGTPIKCQLIWTDIIMRASTAPSNLCELVEADDK